MAEKSRKWPGTPRARCRRPSARNPISWRRSHAYTFDLPLELHAARLAHAPPHLFAERFDVAGGCMAAVDEKVAMHGRDLSVADRQPPAAGPIDESPSLFARRVLEGRAAGFFADRLGSLSRAGDSLHLRLDRGGIAGAALQHGAGEDHAGRDGAMPVGEAHLGVREDAP